MDLLRPGRSLDSPRDTQRAHGRAMTALTGRESDQRALPRAGGG